MHGHDPLRRPNILAGSGGRQFSFGGRATTQANKSTASNSVHSEVSMTRSQLAAEAESDETSKSPFTYALHVVFTSFVRIAEKKIGSVLGPSPEAEPDINAILGHGVDPAFDKILTNLGYIARRNPKPVIDSVMFWRKSRSELKSETNPSMPLGGHSDFMSGTLDSPVLQRRPTDLTRPSYIRSPSSFVNHNVQSTAAISRDAAILSERRSLVSIYILCRALIEIVKQISGNSLGSDVAEKLEEIVFNQLKNADPESLQASPLRNANWNLFAELLGSLSTIRFASVSDRFIADLERFERGPVSKEWEARVEMIISGMRHLRIRIYPAACLEESAEFLSSVAGFFVAAHGFKIKQAYAEVLYHLMLPIPDMVQLVHPKATKMLEKTRYWETAFPLVSTLLSVAPREVFLDKWYTLVEHNYGKLKERAFRNIFIQNLARLIWVACFRCSEEEKSFARKFDTIFRTIFPPGKRIQQSMDLPQAPLVQMLRFVGFKHQELFVRSILLPLIGADHLNNTTSLVDLDSLSSERVSVAIRSFLCLLKDLEPDAVTVRFPVNFDRVIAQHGSVYPVLFSRQSNFKSSTLKEFYGKFCAYLFRIAILCDQHFGGFANATDRLATNNRSVFSQTDHPAGSIIDKERQSQYDLLAAILEALPGCLMPSAPLPRLVEIICKATLHLDSNVRVSAEHALKAIAHSEKIQAVVIAYANVMLKSESLSPQTTEAKLNFFVQLLDIWVNRIRSRIREGEFDNSQLSLPGGGAGGSDSSRSEEMELINIWTVIEEIEAYGLFFLCNQSRLVRTCAIEILRQISRLDSAMNEQKEATRPKHEDKQIKLSNTSGIASRIIDILLSEGTAILATIMDQASAVERSRTNKLKNEVSNEALIKIAEGESGIDAAIWFKVFPRLIQRCFVRFPITVVLCRNVICNQLVKMQPSILNAIENLKTPNPFDAMARQNSKAATSPESTVEQWKLYLIVACSTLTLTDGQLPGHQYIHGRKRSGTVVSLEEITSARSLFQLALPLLSVDHTYIREAIVTALGCININLYKVLLEDLTPIIRALAESSRQLPNGRMGHIRSNRKLARLRNEITHILQLTSHFLVEVEILEDESILDIVLGFLKDVKCFLSDDDVQGQWEFQQLRRHFCELLESVWESLLKAREPSRWLPFEGRVSCFRMLEEWSNHGPQELVAKGREDAMRQSIMNAHKDNRDRGALTASLEIEKRNVEFAALSAMASLCKGPITQPIDTPINNRATISFEIHAVFEWIAAVFGSTSEKIHSVGRRALTNLLKYNLDFTILYQEAVHQCYTHDFDSKSAQSYFTVLAEVLTEQEKNPCGLSQLLALCLFKAGDRNVDIRSKTLNLLRTTEIRFYGTSCVDSFAAAITNQNPVVYKQAQYLLAAQIASSHEEQKFLIFSECSKFFRLVETRLQRDVVAILLPWLKIIELQLDVDGQNLDAASFMVLVNLYELTLRFSDTLLNEIEGLWTALVTGRYIGNVKAILDFTLSQSVARRQSSFVSCGKQIIVYLSRSSAGPKVTEALLAYLQPRSMVPQLKESLQPAQELQNYAYVADLDRAFQEEQKHVVFSLGQLALIFLVDLIVTPTPDIVTQTPTLLQVVFVMLDHYIPLVQNQAREMFVYLTNNLCNDGVLEKGNHASIHEFLQIIRRREPPSSWTYDEMGTGTAGNTKTTPAAMEQLINRTLAIYSRRIPTLREDWGKIALTWATSCPVRHMACRSFQVFQSLSSSIDQNMLSDMLARLSNTIADSSSDIQTFAMEILCTIKVVVQGLTKEEFIHFPQLFWSTIACLETIHETEYREALAVLENLMNKIDLSAKETIEFLVETMPPKWNGKFDGIYEFLLKGIRSDLCMDQALAILNRITAMPSSAIIGPDTKLLFSVLGNIPALIHALDESYPTASKVDVAICLSEATDRQGLHGLSKVLFLFSKAKYRTADEFIRQITSAIRQAYFPKLEASVLIFLLGLLGNRAPWMKTCTMELLKAILPFVDTRRSEFTGVGADLISPLLRLLQTEYAQAALEVLDKTTAIIGSPKDRQVLRMSLGNRTIRKEYEKTATLFGIPEESGWAVPMPASAAMSTRTNVHAVFYTCAVSLSSQKMPDHVQFHMEDYAYHAPSERSETMLSVDGGESSLGDMVSALHNLDVFFTEDADVVQPARAEPASSIEQASASVYDSRVAAILSRSLARTPSISSFTSPGFDISPRRDRKYLDVDKEATSPLLSNGFSFPKQSESLAVLPTQLPQSPVLSSDDEGERPLKTIMDDDKSEASFRLDVQLKKNNTTIRTKLWSSKESDRTRPNNKKAQKSKGSVDLGPTSPASKGYFWSSNTHKDRT